ncbi:hypothetical protein [Sedimenticola sp.]|uniref:hypothetical protein n=1 Tax=Sedimenticola sp. TaxID=1940285 RepID=UPI003D1090EB
MPNYISSTSSFSPLHSAHSSPARLTSARESESSQDRLQRDLTAFLRRGDTSFGQNVSRSKWHFRSPQLKRILNRIEQTQRDMSLNNLNKLEEELKLWSLTDPNEYETRGDSVNALSRDIRARCKDPFLGQARSAQTNFALVNLVRQVHGDQLHALFCRVFPDLKTYDPVTPETVEKLTRALQTSYVKNFKQAEAMVDRDPAHRLDAEPLSLITEQAAKLPTQMLNVLKDNEVKIIGTTGNVNAYARSKNAFHQPLTNGQETGTYLPNSKEVVVALRTECNEYTLPFQPDHSSANLVLFHLGVALDHTVGHAMLGRTISDSSSFEKAWQADRGLMRNPSLRGSNIPDDDNTMAKKISFAEGIARAFNVSRNLSENRVEKWPNIDHFLSTKLPDRLDEAHRGMITHLD